MSQSSGLPSFGHLLEEPIGSARRDDIVSLHDIQLSQAISLRRIADALESRNVVIGHDHTGLSPEDISNLRNLRRLR